MKNPFTNRALRKRSFVIHPLLFAIFPILFLYTYNIIETPVKQILIPMGTSLVLALLLWVFFIWILRNMLKAGLATTVFLFFFFSYGRFYELLEKWDVFVPGHGYLLPGVLLVFGYCVYFIKLARKDFRAITKVLNVVAAVLIVINLFTITSHVARREGAVPAPSTLVEHDNNTALSSEEMLNLPDIYHIILDEYSSLSTIREYYGYDNSKFASSLVDKGFFIAHESRTHVGATEWSLASVLNMEYITEKETQDIALQKISNNKVANYLRSKGYQFVYIGFMMSNVDADLCHNFYKSEGDFIGVLAEEFIRILWNTTMLRPFYMYFAGFPFENRYRAGTIDSLELLKKLPGMKGPKFVFAHICCPHDPFVFGPEGERVGVENFLNFADRQVYLDQYVFITKEIEKLISVLLENSKAPPIIILQSDHGPKTCSTDAKLRIFNAYFLPDNGDKYLYDSISPVNTYRVIFNHYFKTNFELLEE